MEKIYKYTGWVVIAGVMGFVLIVVFLHIVQPDYDLMNQQMSELALGKYGFFMFFAFCSFSLSLFGLLIGLQLHKPSAIITFFLAVAAISLSGAGVFRLDKATNLHIALVSIAFVLIVLVMYLLPRNVPGFKTTSHKMISWTLGAGTAACIVMGQNVLPMGLAQRGATLCILIWLLWLGFIFIRSIKLNILNE